MFKKVISILMVVFFFAGCAGMNINPAELKGNHARGNWINKTFLMAWADYQRYAQLPNLTDDAKQLLKNKRTVLAEFVNPLYGPVMIFNKAVAGNEIIDDAAWNAMLDKLIELETGWYTQDAAYVGEKPAQVQKLDPQFVLSKAPEEQRTEENLDKILVRSTIESGLRPANQPQAIWEGLLIELIRTGIHALRAMLQQRGLDEAAMAQAWAESWAQVQALNPDTLITIN